MHFQPVISSLIKVSLRRAIFTSPKRFCHWNKDYKPGQFPKTHEDRKIAAAKYNLDLEDYHLYPSDDGYGDYPKLPDICDASKDEFYPYDNPELKRNFNEPLHVDKDLFGEDRYDIDRYYTLRPSFMVQLLQFLGACGLYAAAMWVFEKCKMFPALVPKQFPHQGKKHYTFEIREVGDTLATQEND